jgi:flagellar biosynthesis regulator FlaF
MSLMHMAVRRAYGAAHAALDPREREADVFRRVTGALRAVAEAEGVATAAPSPACARALADNRRLWLAVESAALHPANLLPAPLRANLVSLARAVQRELDSPCPDLGFLIGVNEQIVAGLAARA